MLTKLLNQVARRDNALIACASTHLLSRWREAASPETKASPVLRMLTAAQRPRRCPAGLQSSTGRPSHDPSPRAVDAAPERGPGPPGRPGERTSRPRREPPPREPPLPSAVGPWPGSRDAELNLDQLVRGLRLRVAGPDEHPPGGPRRPEELGDGRRLRRVRPGAALSVPAAGLMWRTACLS